MFGSTNKGGPSAGGTEYWLLQDSSGRQIIVGQVAEDAAVSGDGAPVLIAGRYDASPRAVDDGDKVTLALTAAGAVLISSEMPTAAALADGASNPTSPIVGAAGLVFNGATWDRLRGNQEVTLLASAARTATLQSSDMVNYSHSGLLVFVSVTSITSTPVLTPYLQIKDSISSSYFTIWTASVALESVTTAAYLFQPGGAGGSYSEAVNLRVGRTWRFGMTHADADSATYSVSAALLV